MQAKGSKTYFVCETSSPACLCIPSLTARVVVGSLKSFWAHVSHLIACQVSESLRLNSTNWRGGFSLWILRMCEMNSILGPDDKRTIKQKEHKEGTAQLWGTSDKQPLLNQPIWLKQRQVMESSRDSQSLFFLSTHRQILGFLFFGRFIMPANPVNWCFLVS